MCEKLREAGRTKQRISETEIFHLLINLGSIDVSVCTMNFHAATTAQAVTAAKSDETLDAFLEVVLVEMVIKHLRCSARRSNISNSSVRRGTETCGKNPTVGVPGCVRM